MLFHFVSWQRLMGPVGATSASLILITLPKSDIDDYSGTKSELVIDKTWKIYRSCKDLKSDIELESFKFDSVWHQAAISDRIAMWGGKSFIISDVWFVLEQTLIHSLFLEQMLIIHSLFWVSKWNIQFAYKILLFVSNSKMKCQKFEIYFCCHRL